MQYSSVNHGVPKSLLSLLRPVTVIGCSNKYENDTTLVVVRDPSGLHESKK